MTRVLLLFVLLALVACGSAEDEPLMPTAEPGDVATVATVAPATPVPGVDPTEETSDNAATIAPEAVDTGDFIVSASPDEAIVVREYDNIKGAPEARITIIEYGDFQ